MYRCDKNPELMDRMLYLWIDLRFQYSLLFVKLFLSSLQTIGGHLAVAPWISDLLPILVATDCSVTILKGNTKKNKTRKIKKSQTTFGRIYVSYFRFLVNLGTDSRRTLSLYEMLQDEENLYGKTLVERIFISKSNQVKEM